LTAARRVAAVVLAAGLSTRFPGDKLLHPFMGKPLAEHIALTLVQVPVVARIAVCPPDNPARGDLFLRRGFEVAVNTDPGRGMGTSLAVAAERASALDLDAMLVCLADMPLVTREHLEALLALDADVVATEAAGVRSPPIVFARAVFPDLLKLTGDTGPRHLLTSAALVEADPEIVRDFDTPEDFL
jgi:molybdenum cofactor cytidylyltransferase